MNFRQHSDQRGPHQGGHHHAHLRGATATVGGVAKSQRRGHLQEQALDLPERDRADRSVVRAVTTRRNNNSLHVC